jgi:hypothetical protein
VTRIYISCRRILAVLSLLFTSFLQDSARAQQLEAAPVVPAIDGILKAFRNHALVAIGDDHNSAQEEDFYAALVRDPRFSTEVGNVVVEFGGAAQQDTLDRYLNGQEVSYTDLRNVWTDVVGWIPTVTGLGYANFFAQVRAVNLGLPPDRRIHVWLARGTTEAADALPDHVGAVRAHQGMEAVRRRCRNRFGARDSRILHPRFQQLEGSRSISESLRPLATGSESRDGKGDGAIVNMFSKLVHPTACKWARC